MTTWCASLAMMGLAGACATRTPTPQARDSLEQQASLTLGEMNARDPALSDLLASSAGYAVFPDIGAAGAAR